MNNFQRLDLNGRRIQHSYDLEKINVDKTVYEKDNINNIIKMEKFKEYINSDKVSNSILDYNKRKISNEQYLKYLKQLNKEGLVKYKGKDINKLFFNIETSGNYIQFGYDSFNKRLKVLQQYIEQHTLAPLWELSKSRKNAIKVATMINYINQKRYKELYFITLTIPNVPIEKLKESIEEMNKVLRSITTNKKYKKFDVSFIKKIESTYNAKDNQAHPHFHFIFEINKEEVEEFWEYLLSTWFKKFKGANRLGQDIKELDLSNPLKAAQEVAAYTAKSNDYLNHGYEVFKNFYLAFHNKSSLTFTGIFKELNKLFKDKELEEYIPDELKEATEITHYITLRWNLQEQKYDMYISEVFFQGTEQESQKFIMQC